MQDRDKLPMEQQMFYMSPPGAGQFMARNVTLENLISLAYGFDPKYRLAGKPPWMDSTFYEVSAKPEGDSGLSYDQLKPYLQDLLQERFHLAFHHETKNMKGYALVAAKGGPKLTTTKGNTEHAYLMPSQLDAVNVDAGMLASMLSRAVGAPIIDETGLKGKYDFRLNFAPLEAVDSSLPSIYTALEEQLGLRLERRMVSVDVFVIDQVDREPTEN